MSLMSFPLIDSAAARQEEASSPLTWPARDAPEVDRPGSWVKGFALKSSALAQWASTLRLGGLHPQLWAGLSLLLGGGRTWVGANRAISG